MEHPEMRNTVFGEVVAELAESRNIPATPFNIGKLAEDAGLDGWAFINRMADADADYPGDLGGLADKLDLTEPEKMGLAQAFAFERREHRPSDDRLLRRLTRD